jgi:Raf kinase inhibitor-like YbhB/YbcL family protein
MWDHWVLFNIDPSVTEVSDSSTPPCVVGLTTFGHTRYGGPCPPNGEHRYFFKLYALNCRLNLPERSNKHAVEKAMQGHVLAECSLMGRYEKNKGY